MQYWLRGMDGPISLWQYALLAEGGWILDRPISLWQNFVCASVGETEAQTKFCHIVVIPMSNFFSMQVTEEFLLMHFMCNLRRFLEFESVF